MVWVLEQALSINRLERLLAAQPENHLESAALYELYKNYTDLANNKAEVIKNQLINKYSDLDYASLIRGKITSQQQKDEIAQQFLDSLSKKFDEGKIVEVAQQLNDQSTQYRETAIAPKIEMLKAKATARLQGIVHYQKILEKIAIDFPDTDESQQAKELLSALKSIEKESFISEGVAKSWKIIIVGTTQQNRELTKKMITEKLKTISEKLFVTEDVYDYNETWLVVHALKNKQTAEDILKNLTEIITKEKLSTDIIPTENYRLVQIKKNYNELKK